MYEKIKKALIIPLINKRFSSEIQLMNRFWNVFYMDILGILSANQKWLPFEVSGKELIMANSFLSSAASFIIINAFIWSENFFTSKICVKELY